MIVQFFPMMTPIGLMELIPICLYFGFFDSVGKY